jgi:hypothetical protein
MILPHAAAQMQPRPKALSSRAYTSSSALCYRPARRRGCFPELSGQAVPRNDMVVRVGGSVRPVWERTWYGQADKVAGLVVTDTPRFWHLRCIRALEATSHLYAFGQPVSEPDWDVSYINE